MAKRKHPNDLLKHTGLRLLCARLALGLDQERLARAIGVSRSALNNYEHGDRTPDPYAMARLELRFGVPMGWVYAGELRGILHDLQERLLTFAAQRGAELGGLFLPGMPPAEPVLVRPQAPSPPKRSLHEPAPAAPATRAPSR